MSMRNSVNTDFYGRPVTARQLLLEAAISPPAAAQPLFTALTELLAGPVTLPAQAVHSLDRYSKSIHPPCTMIPFIGVHHLHHLGS